MKIFPFLLLAAVMLLTSCSGSKPDMSRPALTGVRTPVYEGMVSAMSGTRYAWLKPLTTVYVQGDSIKIQDQGFVKVWWNDSSGYVPAGWVLLNGKVGVLSAIETTTVYSDASLATPADATFGDWITIPVGELTDRSVQVMYDVEGDPAIGYIDRTRVFLDPIDIEFYAAFAAADGTVGSYEAIRNDSRWMTSALRKAKFGDDGEGESAEAESAEGEDVPYWAQKKDHVEPIWYRDETHVQLTAGEYPGEFALNYMWEDSTLSDINHFGDTLGNSYESCVAEFHKQVAKYVIAFTPKEATDFSLEANIVDTQRPKQTKKEFTNVVAGTKYTFAIKNDSYDAGCNPVTFTVRMKDQRYAVGSIGNECGD